jgi:hypothetical protein
MNQQEIATPASKAGEVRSPLRGLMVAQEPMTIEHFRRVVAVIVLALYVIWVLLGFIVFLSTGNLWLLISCPVLTYPFRRVVDYYFGGRMQRYPPA